MRVTSVSSLRGDITPTSGRDTYRMMKGFPMVGFSAVEAGLGAGAEVAGREEAGVGLARDFQASAGSRSMPGAWPQELDRQSLAGEEPGINEEPGIGEEARVGEEPHVEQEAHAGEEPRVSEDARADEEPRVDEQAAIPTAAELARIDLGPPKDVHADAGISAKLNEHATPEMRARLVHVNTVVQEQNKALQDAVDIGAKPGATVEEKLTATNAKAAQGHIFDAVSKMRQEIGASTNPAELDAAISNYGKQASMIGGSLGKTVMGLKTLGVRQNALSISKKNLGVAIAGGVGLGAAAIIPSSISASNSSKAANNTANKQGE